MELYKATPETLKETLDKYGVAIIQDVLNDDECHRMIKGMWHTLEHLTQSWPEPIKENKPSSWRNITGLFPKHSMLLQQNIGHAQFIWDLRQNPKCVNIFANLWNCNPEDLLVSFDGASFHMPSEETKIGWRTKVWYHTDQSYTRNDFECVQCWATGLNVNENDATLAFYEKSHKYHKEFAEQFNIKDKDNWYKLETEEQINFYRNKGCTEKFIECPRGSLVFWDSRTIHCGVQPQKGRKEMNFRCAVYLCYMPRHIATKADIKKKIKAFEEMRMTSHWPCKVKLFPKMPRTYGAEIKEVVPLSKPELSELGKRLVGY